MLTILLNLLMAIWLGGGAPSAAQNEDAYTACDGDRYLPARVRVGDAVRAVGAVNLRTDTLIGEDTVITIVNNQTDLMVVAGPRCTADMVWWMVQIQDDGTLGWAAEGDRALADPERGYQGYLLEPDLDDFIPIADDLPPVIDVTPYDACGSSLYLPSRLYVGMVARPIGQVNLRRLPNTDPASQVTTLYADARLNILDGPRCIADVVWWQVEIEAVRGWVAESDAGAIGNTTEDGYLLVPIDLGTADPDAESDPVTSASVESLAESVEPQAVCSDPRTLAARLSIDGRARNLSAEGLLVRADPDPSSQTVILWLMPYQTVFTVLDGPRCGATMVWWYVGYDDNTKQGWIAEGDGGGAGYFVEPVR